MNQLGEIFYQGNIVNLSNTPVEELQKILLDIRKERTKKKEDIDNILYEIQK